jgi:ABC-type sugar transport system ATPase subunit
MITIRLEKVRTHILKEIDLTVTAGELFVLLGPSGAGKSTLLKTIAGLLSYNGRIFFDDQCIDRLPPYRRKVGYLFQDLLLFPHLTVQNNLILAMTHLKQTKHRIRQKAKDILSQFGISHLADRFPANMSGGEKQRAALARAIATEPRILLLDEPFSSLDDDNAEHLRSELRQHQRHFKITTIFVTHNRHEAHNLADRLGSIEDGRLVDYPNKSKVDRTMVNSPVDVNFYERRSMSMDQRRWKLT